MKKQFVSIFYLVVTFIGAINSVYAEQKNSSLEAHYHGLSELTIVMEGELLEIQLTSPAMNLVGFEYKASSEKDMAAIKNAESMLQKHKTIFSIFGSNCEHVRTAIDTSSLVEVGHNQGHDNDHHNDNHEDKDNHEDHSEMLVNYSYLCQEADKLSSIEVFLFKLFPGIHKIHAMWIMQSKQGSATFTANNPIVIFR